MSYKLSATLTAHSSDVRAVVSPTNDLVLSASRDSSAISWQRDSPSSTFNPVSVLKAGSRYVNAIAYISPIEAGSKGYAVTGGQDTVINVFSLDSLKEDPDYSLVGHSENVCALDTTPAGTIISGSWDRTAKVWKNWQLAYELRGHEQSVWAVLAVDEEQILTGSADKTIKLWQQHKCVMTFTGHQDAVRGLSLVPDLGFASCSNDSEIRVWTLGGDVIYTLSGHTSFVYSLTVLPSGDIVSSGEDRSVRVWKDGECAQVITHPAISVWTVSSMPNGDIVSGSSDGVVRVFSASEERWASESDLKEYDDLLAKQALPTQQVGDVNKEKLPGVEALATPGDKPGKVQMIRNGDVVEAHQWDAGTFTWKKIGDVVDAVGAGRKQLYEGKEYDYVFDVDIQDGVPPLKLPFNVVENPYSAAQRFLERNELPTSYLDEVVRFIEQNTKGVNIGSNDEYVDPFTGGSRYRSSAASVPTGPASQYIDPYTGASRYTGSPAAQAGNDVYMDPFTGASRYSGAQSVTTPPPKKLTILPVIAPVTVKQANVAAMQNKMLQLNDLLRNDALTSTLALQPQESSAVEEIFLYLHTVTPTTTGPSNLSSSHAEALISILGRWPHAHLFPVIDLCRLVAGFGSDIFAAKQTKLAFVQALFKASDFVVNGHLLEGAAVKTRDTNVLLTLRVLTNLLATAQSWEAFKEVFDEILGVLTKGQPSGLNKQQRIAWASLLFNLSCVALQCSLSQEVREAHISLLVSFLVEPDNEAEAAYRGLVALGNALIALKQRGKTSAQTAAVLSVISGVSSRIPEERVKSVVAEIRGL